MNAKKSKKPHTHTHKKATKKRIISILTMAVLCQLVFKQANTQKKNVLFRLCFENILRYSFRSYFIFRFNWTLTLMSICFVFAHMNAWYDNRISIFRQHMFCWSKNERLNTNNTTKPVVCLITFHLFLFSSLSYWYQNNFLQ